MIKDGWSIRASGILAMVDEKTDAVFPGMQWIIWRFVKAKHGTD